MKTNDDEDCERKINKNILEKFLETSDEYVEREICECKKTFREKLVREPTDKEIEDWLIS